MRAQSSTAPDVGVAQDQIFDATFAFVAGPAGDNQITSRLGWMSLGYTDIDDDALERISQR
ncbi:MAG: hypothetical protein Q4P15_05625 [Propionibacteriaceae bacterium]|nr:hypothetical protein [Propionibacteriaceae bacterium]